MTSLWDFLKIFLWGKIITPSENFWLNFQWKNTHFKIDLLYSDPEWAVKKILLSDLWTLKCPRLRPWSFLFTLTPGSEWFHLLSCLSVLFVGRHLPHLSFSHWIVYLTPHLTSPPVSANKHDLTNSTQTYSSVFFTPMTWLQVCLPSYSAPRPQSCL